MITLQQELEEQRFGRAFGHRFQPDRPQTLQRAFNGPLVMLQVAHRAIAQAINRGGDPRRQPDVAAGLQFEQQGAAGHILEPAGAVAPVPNRTQLTG